MDDQIAATIISKIKAHASQDVGEVTLDTELSELGIHSLELTEIIFDLEDEYGIQIDMSTSEAWTNLSNVRDIVAAVQNFIQQKG